MAEGTRQLSPVYNRRQRAGAVALLLLAGVGGSAIVATLVTGITNGLSTDPDGLLFPALFTLWQALLSTLLSLALAIPVAVALESLHGTSVRKMLLTLFALPLSLPSIVVALAIVTVAGRSGWLASLSSAAGVNWRPDIYGLSGILFAHVFFNMPLAVRMLVSAFEGIPEEQWKLSASLKFPFKARFSVLLLPAVTSAVPGIAGLVFMLCAASYTIILVLGGGPAAATLQTAIQQALTFDLDIGRAAWLTCLQLALTVTLVMALPRAEPAFGTGLHAGRRWHVRTVQETSGAVAIAGLAGLFIGIPALAILVSGLGGDHARILGEHAFWRAVSTSVIIGVSSSLLALILSWLLAAARTATSGNNANAGALFDRVPMLLIGLPPLVLGTGWFLIALQAGDVSAFAPWVIIAANTLLAVPFALQILTPALAAHFNATDRLAASLRLSGWQRLRIADVPALRRPLVQAFLLAFALSLGDLGVVTLFGSDQVLTFPALIYAKLGAYRTNDAAVLSLYLALFTGLAAILATIGTGRDRG